MRLFELALPFRRFPKLFHVGSMNPTDKRNNSFEGAGLSVSEHPDEWAKIARLAGPVWSLTKSGNRFLDFHRLKRKQRETITRWGIDNSFAEPMAVYRLTYFDPDIEEDRYVEFESRAEAEEEADDVMYEDLEPRITEHPTGLKALPLMGQRTGIGRISDTSFILDLIATIYVEDALPGVDGVWWDDRLDVVALSAPRGVIVPRMLATWTIRREADLP